MNYVYIVTHSTVHYEETDSVWGSEAEANARAKELYNIEWRKVSPSYTIVARHEIGKPKSVNMLYQYGNLDALRQAIIRMENDEQRQWNDLQ